MFGALPAATYACFSSQSGVVVPRELSNVANVMCIWLKVSRKLFNKITHIEAAAVVIFHYSFIGFGKDSTTFSIPNVMV